MPIEFEYRFYKYNKEDILDKVKELGGKQIHPPVLYSSYKYYHPYNNKKSIEIRVRKEYNKTCLTLKKKSKNNFDDEYEVEVSDFEQIDKILLLLGAKHKYFVEKIREKWLIQDRGELVFDQYPGAPEYMEIESTSKKLLDSLVNDLEVNQFKFKGGYKRLLFEEYKYKQNHCDYKKPLTFKNAEEKIKPDIKDNIDLFLLRLMEQKCTIGIKKNI